MVDQSNLYASQNMEAEAFSEWTKFTVQELKTYLSFYILMGLVQLPTMYNYWSTNQVYQYSAIADRISGDCFFWIA